MKGTFLGSHAVQYQMRLFVVVALIAMIVGCKGQGEPEAKVEQPPVVTEQPKEEPERVSESTKMPVAPAVPASVYAIGKSGTKGWKPVLSPLESLGEKMDAALRNNKPTMVETSSTFDDSDYGQMRATPTLKIETPERFNITSVVPSDEGETRLLIGDGDRRVVKVNKEWKELNSFSSAKKIDPEDAVKRWPMEFQALMFSLYSEGADIWKPLLSGWQSGKDGYVASVEEQSFVVGGKTVAHYRVLARKEGKQPVETELIIDKQRLLPLTIRVQSTREGGKEYKAMWTGNWKFGGAFGPNDFLVPVARSK